MDSTDTRMMAIIKISGSAILLTGLIFFISLLPLKRPALGPIENIHGIPYPTEGNSIIVTEELAHADIYLREPVLAKKIILEIDFEPGNLTSLSVGIREDSFWLSYGGKQEIYSTPTLISPSREGEKPEGVSTISVTIPLTDKLQEPDRSLDLMFFAEPLPAPRSPQGEVGWELHNIQASVVYAQPAYAQFRNYISSILKRERAL